MAKHIIFDVVGTCVSFDAYFASIVATISKTLHPQYHPQALRLHMDDRRGT
jgi:hypothetical protein